MNALRRSSPSSPAPCGRDGSARASPGRCGCPRCLPRPNRRPSTTRGGAATHLQPRPRRCSNRSPAQVHPPGPAARGCRRRGRNGPRRRARSGVRIRPLSAPAQDAPASPPTPAPSRERPKTLWPVSTRTPNALRPACRSRPSAHRFPRPCRTPRSTRWECREASGALPSRSNELGASMPASKLPPERKVPHAGGAVAGQDETTHRREAAEPAIPSAGARLLVRA